MFKCRDCSYWVEAKGYQREENVGGCTFTLDLPRYYPMFLDEECQIKEPYKSTIIEEHNKSRTE